MNTHASRLRAAPEKLQRKARQCLHSDYRKLRTYVSVAKKYGISDVTVRKILESGAPISVYTVAHVLGLPIADVSFLLESGPSGGFSQKGKSVTTAITAMEAAVAEPVAEVSVSVADSPATSPLIPFADPSFAVAVRALQEIARVATEAITALDSNSVGASSLSESATGLLREIRDGIRMLVEVWRA